MTITPGTYYRVTATGSPGGSYTHTIDGRTVEVRWASGTVQASESVEPPGHNKGNVPVVHVTVLQELASNGQLEPIESDE